MLLKQGCLLEDFCLRLWRRPLEEEQMGLVSLVLQQALGVVVVVMFGWFDREVVKHGST